jgi:hypothetical protein
VSESRTLILSMTELNFYELVEATCAINLNVPVLTVPFERWRAGPQGQ